MRPSLAHPFNLAPGSDKIPGMKTRTMFNANENERAAIALKMALKPLMMSNLINTIIDPC